MDLWEKKHFGKKKDIAFAIHFGLTNIGSDIALRSTGKKLVKTHVVKLWDLGKMTQDQGNL